MSLLRYTAVVALAIWSGGLVALGVAAPTLFRVLEAQDPTAGRETGGLVFGAIFNDFQHVAWGLAAVFLISLILRAAIGPPPRRFRARLWTGAAMLAGSLATSLVLVPRIDAIRAATPGAIANLAPDDSQRVAFDRLHDLATIGMCLTIAAGFALTWAEMSDR